MEKGRYKLNDVDEFAIKMAKKSIKDEIETLKRRGLNSTTIEIILTKYMKKVLKELDDSK